MALGSLQVEVAANVARFASDMGKMAQIAEDRMKQVDKAISTIQNSLKGLAAATGIALTFEKIKSTIGAAIEASAGLENLAQRTGATVEGLSAIAYSAKLVGTDTDTLALAMQKMAKALTDAADGGKKTGAAFQAIGLSAAELKKLKPDEAFKQIADALDRFKDGADKVAVAQALFGKAGANLLPTLKQLAESGDLVARTTTAQAKAAEEYEKDVRRLQVAQNGLYRTIGAELVPVLDTVTKYLIEVTTSTNSVGGAVKGLAEDHSIRRWAEEAVKSLSYILDAFQIVRDGFLTIGKFIGATVALMAAKRGERSGITQAFQEDMAELRKSEEVGYGEALRRRIAFERANERVGTERGRGTTGDKQVLDFKPNSGKQINDEATTFAAAIKIQEALIAREKQLLTQRDADLKRSYEDDLLSINSYFAARNQATLDELGFVLDAYAKETAAAEEYLARAKDINEKTKAKAAIEEIEIKRLNAIGAAVEKVTATTREGALAARAYGDTVAGLNIQLLTMQGRLEAAAIAQEALSQREIRKRASTEGDADTLKTLDALKERAIQQAKINELDQQAALISQQQTNAEGRADLLTKIGAQGELAAMSQIGEARKRSVQQLEEIAAEMDRVAQATGDKRLIANAEAFRLKLDELRASADVLGNTFDDIFKNSFTSAFEGFINGTTSARKAFASFAASVVSEINKIIAKELASKLFGGGGIGGLFSSLFGGAGAAAGGGEAAIGNLGAASIVPGLAAGGPVTAGQLYEVNERGMPELASFNGKDYLLAGQNGRVSALDRASGGGNVVNQTINVLPGADARTAQQAAAAAGAAVQRAMRRNA